MELMGHSARAAMICLASSARRLSSHRSSLSPCPRAIGRGPWPGHAAGALWRRLRKAHLVLNRLRVYQGLGLSQRPAQQLDPYEVTADPGVLSRQAGAMVPGRRGTGPRLKPPVAGCDEAGARAHQSLFLEPPVHKQ
jgi:hypothetical protein